MGADRDLGKMPVFQMNLIASSAAGVGCQLSAASHQKRRVSDVTAEDFEVM